MQEFCLEELHLHYKYMHKKKISPAPSAIIFSLEGVFAAIAAWIILDQVLGLNNLIGCFFILVGVIISQTLPEVKFSKNK